MKQTTIEYVGGPRDGYQEPAAMQPQLIAVPDKGIYHIYYRQPRKGKPYYDYCGAADAAGFNTISVLKNLQNQRSPKQNDTRSG